MNKGSDEVYKGNNHWPVLTRPSLADSNPPADRNFQVSQADRPFGKKLEIPHGSMLPFDSPEGLADEEVIGIVDFVRSNPTYTPPSSKEYPDSFREPIQHDGSAPIVVIEKKAGTIEVRTGTVEGMFSGIGQLIRIVRDGEDFRIIGTGVWVY